MLVVILRGPGNWHSHVTGDDAEFRREPVDPPRPEPLSNNGSAVPPAFIIRTRYSDTLPLLRPSVDTTNLSACG